MPTEDENVENIEDNLEEEEEIITPIETGDDEDETIEVDCDTGFTRNCKYFHSDPYLTPNNFDFYFDYNSIPSNIDIDSPSDLVKKLQRVMPLSKRIHLNLESKTNPQYNQFNLHSNAYLKFITTEEYYKYDYNGNIICDEHDNPIIYTRDVEEKINLFQISDDSDSEDCDYFD